MMNTLYRGMVTRPAFCGTEFSFWGNVDFPTNEEAKKARDAKAKALTQEYKGNPEVAIRRSQLRNQLRPYASLGVPDGRSGHVYTVTVERKPLF